MDVYCKDDDAFTAGLFSLLLLSLLITVQRFDVALYSHQPCYLFYFFVISELSVDHIVNNAHHSRLDGKKFLPVSSVLVTLIKLTKEGLSPPQLAGSYDISVHRFCDKPNRNALRGTDKYVGSDT